MPRVTKTVPENNDLMERLGAGIANVSGSNALFAAVQRRNVLPNTATFIIGVGGNGCQTVDAIKHKFVSEFQNWQNAVAFLAMDTAENELNSLPTLDDNEKYLIPLDAGSNSRWINEAGRSDFARTWVNPEFSVRMGNAGAGQIRQAGKARLYDKGRGDNPNDNRIIEKLDYVFRHVLGGAIDRALNIIIILGTAGGTGSGAIIEMPHLVRRAISHPRMRIFGYFYLPDTCDEFDRNSLSRQELKRANGYAALKELEYYQCMLQRPGCREIFSCNRRTGLPKYFSFDHAPDPMLYDIPFLVSAPTGTVHANATVRASIVEAVVNIISDAQNTAAAGGGNAAAAGGGNAAAAGGDGAAAAESRYLFESWLANNERVTIKALINGHVNADGTEEEGIYCEDSFSYMALGVGTASIPEETVKAYAVSEVMKEVMGMKRAGTAITHPNFNGFRQEPLDEAGAKPLIGQMLIDSVQTIQNEILSRCTVRLPNEFARLNISEIKKGERITELENYLGINAVQKRAIESIDEYLQNAYTDTFLRWAKEFLIEYGPKAFADMANGAAPGEGAAVYRGILAHLGNLESVAADDNTINAAGKQQGLDNIETRINRRGAIVGFFMQGIDKGNWHRAKLELEKFKIAQKVKEHVFGAGGATGAIRTLYTDKIREFIEQCEAFARVLTDLTNIYANLGFKFSSREEFLAHDGSMNFNVISTEAQYEWVRGIANNAISGANVVQLKAALINSFMQNPADWTEYAGAGIMEARKRFDALAAEDIQFPTNPDTGEDKLSIVSFIRREAEGAAGINAVAGDIVKGVLASSKVLCNTVGPVPWLSEHKYMLLPRSIYTTPELLGAFRDAVAINSDAGNMTIYSTDSSSSIVCYRTAAGVPIYSLQDLPLWYSAYCNNGRIFIHGNESDKGDFNPDTGLRWEDYPELVMESDPRIPDDNDEIGKEGRFLIDIFDPIFNKALEYGVIAEKQDDHARYSYEMYDLTNPAWRWSFDVNTFNVERDLDPDENGFYPKGRALIEHLLSKNNANIAAAAKRVKIDTADKFTAPLADRKLALNYAKRALRRHVPMFLKVKKTLRILEPFIGKIDEANKQVEQRLEAQRAQDRMKEIAKLIAYGFLKVNGSRWMYNDYPVAGREKFLCNMKALSFDDDEHEKEMFNRGMRYCILARWHKNSGINSEGLLKDCAALKQEVSEEKTSPSSYIENLEPFKTEADDFIKKYGSEESKNEDIRALKAALRCNDEQIAIYINLYKDLLALYEDLSEFVEK